jgi:hypothetical protein
MVYEVWEKSELVSGNGTPEDTCYVIDTAILLCKKLSTGTTTKKIFVPKPGAIPGWWGMVEGTHKDVSIPKAFALIDVGKTSIIIGWGIGGVYMSRKDCKRCANTGEDGDNVCVSCKGSSYNPL